MVKNASNEVETLTLKYDIIDLELRCGEFKNGTGVKIGLWTMLGGLYTPYFCCSKATVGRRAVIVGALDFLCVAFFGWRPSKRTSHELDSIHFFPQVLHLMSRTQKKWCKQKWLSVSISLSSLSPYMPTYLMSS